MPRKTEKFYHGTAEIFEYFDTDSRGTLTAYPGSNLATFFAASKADASFYAYKSEACLELTGQPRNRRIITVNIEMSNLLIAEDDTMEIDGNEININDDDAIFRAAREEGYQGVRFPYGNANNSGDTVAVFDLSIVHPR